MTEEAKELHYESESVTAPRWVMLLFVVLFAGLAFALWRGHTANQELQAQLTKAGQRSDMLAEQLDKTNTALAEVKGQLNLTMEKLGVTREEISRARAMAATLQKEQEAAELKLAQQIGEVRKDSDAKLGAVAGEVSGAKADIEATRKDLEATKSGLQRVMGDAGVMSGLIARNKEELEELKRRGERNYYEFDIRKSNTAQRIGPIQVRLNKVDVKKSRYTITLLADDKTIEKRDKTVNEPVQFYAGAAKGRGALHEIVVFELAKDRAVGYLTTPKEMARP
jgi:septal ring factor EnvC (AmiA/AmiB activator)